MKNYVLTAPEAAKILYPYSGGVLRSSHAIGARVVSHFSFTPEDLRTIAIAPPPADLEILLCGLGVGSLEELYDLVEEGKRVRSRTPLVIV